MKEENPWNVQSLYDLLYFNCPSCAYKNHLKQEFVDHAYQLHPESEQYLRNISDGSLSDVEIPHDDDDDDIKFHVKEEKSCCNICDITFCNQNLLQEHENLVHPSEVQFNNHQIYYNPIDALGSADNYEDEDIKEEKFESTKDVTTRKPKKSKYDEYFEINHITKEATCLICTKILRKNPHGMREHLNSKHQIIIEVKNTKEDDSTGYPDKHECETCNESFLTEHQMNEHIFLIHKKMKCPECEKCFRSQLALDEHINRKHNENLDKVECDQCSKMIAKSHYHFHLVKNHGVEEGKKIECEYCEKKFDDKKTLRIHFKSEHSEITGKYKCQVCGKSFLEKVNLMQHHIRVHNKKFECQDCGHSVGSKYDLELHVKVKHSGANPELEKVECEKCGKKYGKSSLHTHLIRVHGVGGERCKCNVEKCGKEFNHKKQLEIHMKNFHSDVNIVQCKICGKLLKKGSLDGHIKTVHEGIKEFMCSLCGKEFTNKQTMKLHDAVHTGVRAYECKICMKTFKTPSHLLKHNRFIHELNGKKLNICSYCGKGFAEKQQMKRHSETVHEGIKKYTCDLCPMAYGQSHELKKHKLKIHQI